MSDNDKAQHYVRLSEQIPAMPVPQNKHSFTDCMQGAAACHVVAIVALSISKIAVECAESKKKINAIKA